MVMFFFRIWERRFADSASGQRSNHRDEKQQRNSYSSMFHISFLHVFP